MIYPANFERKIGFSDIRALLRERCLCPLGRELVDEMAFSTDADEINERLEQVREYRGIADAGEDFPLQYFFDMRPSLARIRVVGTHLEEEELFNLRRSLDTTAAMAAFLRRDGDGEKPLYPSLKHLTEDVRTFPATVKMIDRILDKFGRVSDTASPALSNIRHEMAKAEGSVSRTLSSILRSAQNEGLIDKDVAPTMRDGRLVLPLVQSMKRKIQGIVHDESASGKTVFVEPAEVVEANNRIRELEAEERREIIRILIEATDTIRPDIEDMLHGYTFMAQIDFIRAKTELASLLDATTPRVLPQPNIDWAVARHPLLYLSLKKQEKSVVPLDMTLEGDNRLVIISGPNAGGKSVCLKTVGILQYMVQCSLPVPVAESSRPGVFRSIMIDIGDEQSIEDDLSTYSGHLMNMKQMMRHCDPNTLLLIDEFGAGTEPLIGGAIAEAVLKQFCGRKTWGIITTHYQNLKRSADSNEGVINAAMLYDRHEMRPLFQLSIGRPGSSFAIEIARKTGLPEQVINDASAIVGSDYIQSDKYLQDIVRDKRYWESKRRDIHQREKQLQETVAKYEADLQEIKNSRREVLKRAKEQAEELLKQTNKTIENTIREIREKQAEKEDTRRLREELDAFKSEISSFDTAANDELITRKMQQIQDRKRRRGERRQRKHSEEAAIVERIRRANAEKAASTEGKGFSAGDKVSIKGTTTVGEIESIEGTSAIVLFGSVKTKTPLERLNHATAKDEKRDVATANVSRATRETMEKHREQFRQDLDVRGMRGDEAVSAVMYFIDDAILVGMPRVRILHGKGNGILRQLIREYLATVPNVTAFRDEHVQFGGAGITVVDL